jgi:serine/threonine protein kinase
MVETSRFTEHLERANLESAQSYKDDHIVKLIHAYSLGGVMNLIFPLAATNLDQLLRNPIDRYRDARVGRLESCNAWTQLLGIARALAKIAGTPTNVAPTGLPTESRAQQWIGFHFDLKPANILVSEIGDSGTWLITDFGQSSFTFTSEQTPRARNDGGTDAYAPPEIIHNQEKQFSRRYDVWSLGCLALEVVAFVVLGYDGLTGPSGLDEVRQLHDGWSRLTDSRFWYRRSENAAPEVKPSITKFMTHLSNSARNLDKRSRKFLTEVLKLIERMLQPAVQHRIEIGEVIRILEATITQASKRDDEGQLLQTVPGPDERDIGAPELGQVQLRHWNRISEQWQDSVLRVFEDRKGNLRFYSVAHNRYPSEITLHRQNDAILPYYAFWEHEIPQGSESWLGFCSLDPKGVPEHLSLLYGFERLLDSRFVQSRLTYQNIEKSFSLSNVQIHKYVKIGRKVINVFARTFKSKEPHDVTQSNRLNEETHLDGRDLGPATIQLWTEEEDPGAVERQENESVMSRTASTARKHKIQIPQQQGDRSVLTRRAVIYLHRYKCIITIKIGVNWIARISSENPKVMHFQPTKPDRDPHFVTSLIQPANGKVAGLPLCPQVLRQIEGQHQFEADRITLHFGIDSQPLELNGKYRLMKQSWEQEKGEVQKLPRDTPARAPHSSQESLSQVPPRDSTRVLGNYAQASMSSYVNKGKGRATRPSTVHEGNEDHNGYTYDVPQPYQNGGNGCLSLQSTQSLSLDWHPTLDPSLRQQFPEATPNGNLSTRPSPYTPRPSATQTVGMTQRQAESSGTGIQARQRDEKQYEKSGISSIESVATDGPIRGGRKRNRAKGGGER